MDHEEVMRQRNAAHAEAMRGANDIAQTKLRAALESTEAKAAAERDAALRRAVAESKRRADTIRSECMKEKAEEMSILQNEHNQVIGDITEAARIERKKALDELSQRARRELDHAVEQLEAQRMKQVKQLTTALQAEQTLKSELQQDLETIREQLEEAEDTVYDQKNAITSVRRVGAQQRLYLILAMLKANREKKQLVTEATREATVLLEKVKQQLNGKINNYKTTVRGLEQEVRLHEGTFGSKEEKVESTVLTIYSLPTCFTCFVCFTCLTVSLVSHITTIFISLDSPPPPPPQRRDPQRHARHVGEPQTCHVDGTQSPIQCPAAGFGGVGGAEGRDRSATDGGVEGSQPVGRRRQRNRTSNVRGGDRMVEKRCSMPLSTLV